MPQATARYNYDYPCATTTGSWNGIIIPSTKQAKGFNPWMIGLFETWNVNETKGMIFFFFLRDSLISNAFPSCNDNNYSKEKREIFMIQQFFKIVTDAFRLYSTNWKLIVSKRIIIIKFHNFRSIISKVKIYTPV